MEYRPVSGTELAGAGKVVEHGQVVDSLGRWHGLIKLIVETKDNPETWIRLLQYGAEVKAVVRDEKQVDRYLILYKLEPR